jgi:hypothetical protein
MRVLELKPEELGDEKLARIVEAVGVPLPHPICEDPTATEIKRRETLSALRFAILGRVAYYRRDVEFQDTSLVSWAEVRDPTIEGRIKDSAGHLFDIQRNRKKAPLPENVRAKDLAMNRKKATPDKISKTSPRPLPDNTSPFELFAARLAPIYEQFFQRAAGASTSSKVGGPFVRFVLAVSKEMNVRVQGNKLPKASTVKAALRKVPEPYRLG